MGDSDLAGWTEYEHVEPAQPYKDILSAVASTVRLSPAKDLKFHILRVGEGAQVMSFDTAESFMENLTAMLKESAGQPVKIFSWYGWRIYHSTPQVMMGVTMAGWSKSPAVVLQRGVDNPLGDSAPMSVS